jgi:hypothetical protein
MLRVGHRTREVDPAAGLDAVDMQPQQAERAVLPSDEVM